MFEKFTGNMQVEEYPLVSICIPTYNGSRYIEDTLKSALQQTYQNIEIIITDDCSSDDTLAICESYAEKDGRVHIFKNKQNLGLVNNWCNAIEKASSKWIKFLFQDDILIPNCVERMIKCALQHHVDFVICDREYFFQDGIHPKLKKFYTGLPKVGTIFPEERSYAPTETALCIAPYLFKYCIGEPPTFLFNKERYSRDDFPDTYLQMIDYVFILNKILKHNFVFINEKLVKFRVHQSSESVKNSIISPSDQEAFYKFLYIQFYEKIQICYDILNHEVFKEIRRYIPKAHVLAIKNMYVASSYKKYGFNTVFPFYKKSKLNTFILDRRSSKYSYVSYKIQKIRYKNVKKKYNI